MIDEGKEAPESWELLGTLDVDERRLLLVIRELEEEIGDATLDELLERLDGCRVCAEELLFESLERRLGIPQDEREWIEFVGFRVYLVTAIKE